ncbi:hypothetical protein Q3W71_14565 [Micromonospora sp. C28SCA-DRY-2]|uniref:hypothetical protein n=1 Tax=Micromonospora sp. C28SCA-DRY-2 TaxID=3059522 RepID=UPI002676E467|nr:hypothetical protein [Micromonospora sp. C28SCA-DRY-2]MDO3702892.1 hypothetical protein [Micromonospora sp. C28SCA-DRY-2]
MTTAAADNVAQIGMITSTVLLIALVAIVAFVALGIYRARHSAAREAHYRGLAEQASDAQARLAESSQQTTAELQGLRSDVKATHVELAKVRERLTELERLLSQIG